MDLIFERGNRSAPKGHALLYFRNSSDPDEVWATYIVVPPIAMDLSKYVPPMFASQMPIELPSGPSAYPLPPIPEKVERFEWLEQVAQARDDDLLDGGRVDPRNLQSLILFVAEAAQRYGSAYSDWASRLPEPEPEREALPEVDVDELLLSVLSDSEKVSRMARLVGSLRYALEGSDRRGQVEATAEMQRLGRLLDAKYRVDELIAAAQQPGEGGWSLAQLYVERAYKIATEDYGAVGPIEERIRGLKQATEHGGSREES